MGSPQRPGAARPAGHVTHNVRSLVAASRRLRRMPGADNLRLPCPGGTGQGASPPSVRAFRNSSGRTQMGWDRGVEQFEQIRRDREREGLSIREPARRYGVHRRAVRPALASPLPPQRKAPERRPAPKLGPIVSGPRRSRSSAPPTAPLRNGSAAHHQLSIKQEKPRRGWGHFKPSRRPRASSTAAATVPSTSSACRRRSRTWSCACSCSAGASGAGTFHGSRRRASRTASSRRQGVEARARGAELADVVCYAV